MQGLGFEVVQTDCMIRDDSEKEEETNRIDRETALEWNPKQVDKLVHKVETFRTLFIQLAKDCELFARLKTVE